MKILIIDGFGQSLEIDSPVVPFIGSKIDAFYRPMPTVKDVVFFPNKDTLKKLTYEERYSEYTALVIVE